LLADLDLLPDEQVKRRASSVRLENGSLAAILAQSQRAVRGLRIQKLRCDEVELFDPRVREAAQMVTKSLKRSPRQAPDSSETLEAPVQGARQAVRGTIEAISTMHELGGLMGRIVDEAEQSGRRVIRWCLMEVLERCEPDRPCEGCPLWNECGGRAKTMCDGFF